MCVCGRLFLNIPYVLPNITDTLFVLASTPLDFNQRMVVRCPCIHHDVKVKLFTRSISIGSLQ